MVEPDEFEQYKYAVSVPFNDKDGDAPTNTVKILVLPDHDLGVGYSRWLCVEHAKDAGFESIILSDDDILPVSGMDTIIYDAEDPLVFAITAWHSYFDLALGVKGNERNDLIIVAPSFTRMFAINIKNVLEVGNFDRNVKCTDDVELKLRGIMAGYPWMIHFNAKAKSFGSRFAPGGVAALEDQFAGEPVLTGVGDVHRGAIEYILAKHRKYVPDLLAQRTETKISYKWSKLHDHFMPGWREWAMLQGGDVLNYMGKDWKSYA